MRFRLLKSLAKSAVKHAGRLLMHLLPAGEVVYDIATDTWQDYWRDAQDDALRDEIQALAQAPQDQLRRAVGEAVKAEAGDQPAEVQDAIAAYLTQVPAAIRRSLRRPSDPSGTTMPPGQALMRPEDLLKFLPTRLPRFKPGDRPLRGVDWVLDEPIGVGGFGEVWRARHAHLRSQRPVALKFCLDPTATAALRNEAGLLDQVMMHGRHPGIVPLLHTYLDADPPCLEFEYQEGGDLAGYIHELHEQGRASPDLACQLILQLAEIVAFAHQADPAIVHGDLKPANILVRTSQAGEVELRVTDFGIGGLAAAQAASDAWQQSRSRPQLLTEAVRGAHTPLYASPEQMRRRPGERADPRDDVHALGVIWLQIITGDLGMMALPSDWREQVEERGLGAELVRLLGSCIAPRAARRPENAAALADQLKKLVGTPDADEGPQQADLVLQPRGIATQPRLWATPDLPPRPTTTPAVAVRLTRPGRRAGELFANDIGMEFAWCPAGTFLMGSPPQEARRDADEVQHRVTLTRGIYLGVHLVTQAQWASVMGSNPSHFIGDKLPVEQVYWEDCQEFCKRLGSKDGRRYRLPTEAEWEYACRAGTTTPFSFGATISTDQANYNGTYTYGQTLGGIDRKATTPVGTFPANPWGLCDIHGNVWEWCQDWYGPYVEGEATDPLGPATGHAHVQRGGSWYAYPWSCRSARRGVHSATKRTEHRSNGGGVRVVLCAD